MNKKKVVREVALLGKKNQQNSTQKAEEKRALWRERKPGVSRDKEI